MAPFNPDVQKSNDPNYLGYSRPISQPEGNRTSETILKGLAGVLDSGIKAADTLVKKDIDNKVYISTDIEREAYTASMEEAKDTLMQGGKTPNILFFAPEDKIPQPLQDIEGSVTNLHEARANGKISPTYYIGRLNTMAKELRSQYPGYRDYIDSKISSVTGMNPANAYLRSVMQDLNSVATGGGKSSADKLLAKIDQHPELPDYPAVRQQFIDGNINELSATKWLNQHLGRKWRREEIQGDIKLAEEDKKLHKEKTEAGFNELSSKSAINHLEGITLAAGIKSGKEIGTMLAQAAAGNVDLKSDDILRLGQVIRAKKSIYKQQAFKEASEDGYVKTLGIDGVNKIIDGNAKVFDVIMDDIHNKDYGAAYTKFNMAKAKANDAQYGLYNDVELGNYFTTASALSAISPEYASEYFKRHLISGVDEKVKPFLDSLVGKAVTQPDIRRTPSAQPYTLAQSVAEARSKGIKSPEFFHELVGMVSDISSPKTPDAIKLNLAKWAYDPSNRDVLNKFAKDSFDKNGRVIPGQYFIFKNMASPAITKEIKRLDAAQPGLWNNYKDWVEETFAFELFSKDLKNLQDINLTNSAKIGWDTENHEFVIKPGTRSENTPYSESLERRAGRLPSGVSPFVDQTINRINMGLRSVSNIAKETNGDVDAYLLGILIDNGYDPLKSGLQNIPERLMQALITARTKREEKVNKDKSTAKEWGRSRYAPDEATPPLQQWLRNPSGGAMKPTTNLSNETLIDMDVQNIPEGMSARDYIQQLKQQGQ